MLPAHWASYLINGDASSFSLDEDEGKTELAVIDKIIENIDAGSPDSIGSEGSTFMTYATTPDPLHGILDSPTLSWVLHVLKTH